VVSPLFFVFVLFLVLGVAWVVVCLALSGPVRVCSGVGFLSIHRRAGFALADERGHGGHGPPPEACTAVRPVKSNLFEIVKSNV